MNNLLNMLNEKRQPSYIIEPQNLDTEVNELVITRGTLDTMIRMHKAYKNTHSGKWLGNPFFGGKEYYAVLLKQEQGEVLKCDQEIGGSIRKAGERVSNVNRGLYFPPNQGTSHSLVEINGYELNRVLERLKPGELVNGWTHCHPEFCTQPSPTDNTNDVRVIARVQSYNHIEGCRSIVVPSPDAVYDGKQRKLILTDPDGKTAKKILLSLNDTAANNSISAFQIDEFVQLAYAYSMIVDGINQSNTHTRLITQIIEKGEEHSVLLHDNISLKVVDVENDFSLTNEELGDLCKICFETGSFRRIYTFGSTKKETTDHELSPELLLYLREHIKGNPEYNDFKESYNDYLEDMKNQAFQSKHWYGKYYQIVIQKAKQCFKGWKKNMNEFYGDDTIFTRFGEPQEQTIDIPIDENFIEFVRTELDKTQEVEGSTFCDSFYEDFYDNFYPLEHELGKAGEVSDANNARDIFYREITPEFLHFINENNNKDSFLDQLTCSFDSNKPLDLERSRKTTAMQPLSKTETSTTKDLPQSFERK